eukprot:TRINITY_DN1577_c0_g1_i2.p2 TRINITY_DN1577_c0_g1~~TRINITY_DN1577_c0_g1_i2.p2  ORF type:complete len:382 (-),score=20.55 TRINITY_DN1577_c0_g1_i2:3994-5139(-)
MKKGINYPPKQIFKITNGASAMHVEWTSQLDEYLKILVSKHKGKEWKSVALEMQAKFANTHITAKKCRERWAACINPEILRTGLKDSEYVLLLIYHHHLHNNWSGISKKIPYRYSSTLKNNFYSIFRSVLRKVLVNEFAEVTGLYLLQATYASWVAVELLNKPGDYKPARGEVPKHIRDLMIEKELTQEKCELHLQRAVKKILYDYPQRERLKPLEKYVSLKMFYELFVAVSYPLEAKLVAAPNLSLKHGEDPAVVQEIIFTEIENVLNPPVSQQITSKTFVPHIASAHPLPFQSYSYGSTSMTPYVPPFMLAPRYPPGIREPSMPLYLMPSTFVGSYTGNHYQLFIGVPTIYLQIPEAKPHHNPQELNRISSANSYHQSK